jgi:hypothetical protein
MGVKCVCVVDMESFNCNRTSMAYNEKNNDTVSFLLLHTWKSYKVSPKWLNFLPAHVVTASEHNYNEE